MNHQVIISDKSRVEIDSVISVKEFDENGVLLETSRGDISIEGAGMRIENFEKATSSILISGDVISLTYIEKRMKKKGRIQKE